MCSVQVLNPIAMVYGLARDGVYLPSFLRLIDFCITQLKAQGPSWTCNESKEEEEVNLQSAIRWAKGGCARNFAACVPFRISVVACTP